MAISLSDRRRRHEMEKILYRLCRRFRCDATLYSVTESSKEPNLETGAVPADVRTTIKLRNFVTFDEAARRRFEYDLSYIAANKNFTYGGVFETGDRIGLISHKDTSQSFDLTDSHYLVFQGIKYRVFKHIALDYGLGYLLHMRRTQNEKHSQLINKVMEHTLVLEQDIATS